MAKKSKLAAQANKPAAPKRQGASSEQLAKLFSCTTRQIEILAHQKIVVRLERGLYDAAQSTQNYIRHLREQAAGRAGLDPSTDTAAANAEKSREQTLLLRSRRLKLEERLIDAAAARSLWGEIVAGIRQFMLGLPVRIAGVVPTLNAQDLRAVELLIHDALNEMALGRGFRFADPGAEKPTAADDVSDPRPAE